MHLFFDVDLETRTAARLIEFKRDFEESEKPTNVTGANPKSSEGEKSDTGSEDDNNVQLVTLTGSKGENAKREAKELINILLDLTLYEYEPLVTSTLGLLFRYMRYANIMGQTNVALDRTMNRFLPWITNNFTTCWNNRQILGLQIVY